MHSMVVKVTNMSEGPALPTYLATAFSSGPTWTGLAKFLFIWNSFIHVNTLKSTMLDQNLH